MSQKEKAKKSPKIEQAGVVPPHNIYAEEVVLGAMMLEKDAYYEVGESLRPESFYDHRHALIFEAIRQLVTDEKPVDILTVTEELRAMKKLEEAGGEVYIAELSGRVTSTAHLQMHTSIVADRATKRELIGFSSDIMTRSYDESEEVEDVMQRAESELFKITQRNQRNEIEHVSEILPRTIKQIEAAYNRKDGISGLPSGFSQIDNMTAGRQNPDLIIIAARPAMGKTAFVLSMAKLMAFNYKIPVAIFSLEMSKEQLLNRFIVNHCEISNDLIKRGELSQEQWQRLIHKADELYQMPIFVDDNAGLSIFDLRSKARRLYREHNVRTIIIDYLQLMTASGLRTSANREQEVSTISRSLKHLAKELNIPVIALSQLNRGVESYQRESKRPQLSDLRESGAIEQDADMVCFLHRPEYYKIYESPDGIDYRGMAEFIIAKHRNGPTGDVLLRFKSELATFTSGLDLDIQNSMGHRTLSSGLNTQKSSEKKKGTNTPPPPPDEELSPF